MNKRPCQECGQPATTFSVFGVPCMLCDRCVHLDRERLQKTLEAAGFPPAPPLSCELILQQITAAAEEVIANAIDGDSFGPELEGIGPDDDHPRDEDGNAWWFDLWELRLAIEAAKKHLGHKVN